MLRLAVPGWLIELRQKDSEYINERRKICCDYICSKGDNILYQGKIKGQTGEAFNRLAEGLAILLLISNHLIEIFNTRFFPDGKWEETEKEHT